MFRKITLCFLLIFSVKVVAQESYYYYFIYLKDKPGTAYSISRPLEFLSPQAIARRDKNHIPVTVEDLPINADYIRSIRSIDNCEVWNTSKWLNAVEVRFTEPSVIDKINTLPFVSKVVFLGKIKINPLPEIKPIDNKFTALKKDSLYTKIEFVAADYGDAFKQNSLINIQTLHHAHYSGNGIRIAIFDAGFSNAYKTPGIGIDPYHIIIRDYVTHDNSVWEDDRHGANVLGFMKTKNSGSYIGTAPNADYMLIRTEDASSEYPTEEVNWLAAAEFADSMGIDLISSSLGYNNFDDTSLSHHYRDLNGRTSIIAQAANIAHSKGIFIVVSAGNEGSNKWHKIGTPSDAPGVITIGATDAEGTHADFSSYGPSEDGRVKPDFAVMGKKAVVTSPNGNYTGNGTSYATPIFAGALACLMQACPSKSYTEIFEALKASSSHGYTPDSAYGYGLPDMSLAAAILGNFQGIDSSKDIFWLNPHQSYWQDQIIHFRSSEKQIVEIKISGIKRSKAKTISNEKVSLKAGEWIHINNIHQLIAAQSAIKKRKKVKEIKLELITSSATYSRVFTLHK